MPTITYNYEPTDEVYIIDYSNDLKAETVVKGTIYRVDVAVKTKGVDAIEITPGTPGVEAVAYQAAVPAVAYQAAVPAVAYQAAVPEVLAVDAVAYQAAVPAVDYQAAIPEVLAQAEIPEVLAVDAIAQVPSAADIATSQALVVSLDTQIATLEAEIPALQTALEAASYQYFDYLGQEHVYYEGEESTLRNTVANLETAIAGGDDSTETANALANAQLDLEIAEGNTANALTAFQAYRPTYLSAQAARDDADTELASLQSQRATAIADQTITTVGVDAVDGQAFVPAVDYQAEIPEVLAQVAVPEVLAVDAIEYQAEIPEVLAQDAIPEVLAVDAIPEVLAVDAVAEVPAINAVAAVEPVVVVKYILRTQYNESVSIEDESLIFANKTDAFDALELRTL